MMRSLFSAVSGLKTHQTRMDVIGNNIANVNTEAFKASSARFSELMYQTLSYASSGSSDTKGGTNAKQIGLGVSMASTMINITSAGSAESTGNAFDLRLADSVSTNFFIVSDGTNTMFTRAGSFYVDGNGYLCMSSTGYKVMGWQLDSDGINIKKDTVSALQVMSGSSATSSPEATTAATVDGVLDSEDTNISSGYVMSLNFYDDLGYSYTAKFTLTKEDVNDNDGNRYHLELTSIQDSNGYDLTGLKDSAGKDLTYADLFGDGKGCDLIYDSNKGYFVTTLAHADTDTAYDSTSATAATDMTFTLDLSKIASGFSTAKDENGIAILDSTGKETPLTSNFKDITIDFSESKNVSNGGKSSLKIEKGDTSGDYTGKKLGALIGLAVDSSGKIYGSYDNGNTELLGQIAVAQFANASGLEKVGDNCYQTTLNSGDFDGIGVEVDADGSSINSGQLEMSNVDLAAQFTDMIITQRGFQANSRVITVSDTLLEELINLKR